MKTQINNKGGIIVLTEQASTSQEGTILWNDDLRPTTLKEHTWTGYSYSTLWVGMCCCLPTFSLAGGMLALGMSWIQAIATIFIGSAIVLIPILLNSNAGTKYGIPYPVFARLWFGSKGAHIPALARGIVAAGWFGINCWLGAGAIDISITAFAPIWANVPGHIAIVFTLFWALNVAIAAFGMEAMRKLSAWAAPLLGVSFAGLAIWAIVKMGGLAPVFEIKSQFTTTGDFLKVFFPSMTGVIAFWATLALNIPDFCRYAKSQKSQAVAQSFALPLTMSAICIISIIVTSATVVLYGEAMWNPVGLLAKFPPFVTLFGTIIVILSCLVINVNANVVAPARAVENISPRRITFWMGVLVTGLFALLLQPWALMANFGNYIFGWLGTYGALLGPIDGIAVSDYWLARGRRIHLLELYNPTGRYSYTSGFNMNGVYALILGIAVSALGLFIPALSFLWGNAWTVGLIVSGVSYYFFMKNDKSLVSVEEFNEITTDAQA
jgi:nucleobase:cation symporter-1, NCS1 family